MEVRRWLGVGIVGQIFILIHGWRGESQCKENTCCRSLYIMMQFLRDIRQPKRLRTTNTSETIVVKQGEKTCLRIISHKTRQSVIRPNLDVTLFCSWSISSSNTILNVYEQICLWRVLPKDNQCV